MNVDRILRLADLVEAQPHTKVIDATGFNMNSFVHLCGTPSCIAGWACALEEGDNAGSRALGKRVVPSAKARKYLGLDVVKAGDLFTPRGFCDEWEYITPSQAAATLRHLAATGVVKWELNE